MNNSLKSISKTKVPRNFMLLEALNKAGNYTHVTYGLADEKEDDSKSVNNYIKMEYWNCTMMYDDGDNLNVFEVLCRCPFSYPDEKPILTFSKESLQHKKIKKMCNSDGSLTENALTFCKWNENMLLGDYLTSVLNVISSRHI